MALLTESEIIKVMRDTYYSRLLEVLGESDVYDKRGNVVLSKDLKVRHKDSQFEYTVDDVEEETDDVQISLNLPDEPRIEPEGADQDIPNDGTAITVNGIPVASTGEEEPDEVFIIDQEEFEKEYEVK
tara:strand:- start:819 stop:1202 length:384 start_codon:yes stop_codon:yes gene_type:complete